MSETMCFRAALAKKEQKTIHGDVQTQCRNGIEEFTCKEYAGLWLCRVVQPIKHSPSAH